LTANAESVRGIAPVLGRQTSKNMIHSQYKGEETLIWKDKFIANNTI